MVSSQTSHYGAFREEDDPNYLGVARERSNWLAKIFLYWVNPLILKGRRDQIKSTDLKLGTRYTISMTTMIFFAIVLNILFSGFELFGLKQKI